MMMHFIEEMSKAERKEFRNTMRNELIKAGGRIYIDGNSGMVLAIKPNIPGNNCKSFRVAAAYCSPKDKFKKSIGEAIALHRLNLNMCIAIRCEYRSNISDRIDEIASDFISTY